MYDPWVCLVQLNSDENNKKTNKNTLYFLDCFHHASKKNDINIAAT